MPRRLAGRCLTDYRSKPLHKQGRHDPAMPVPLSYPLTNRLKTLAAKHHLSPQELFDLFEAQDGCCAICGTHADFLHELVLDHDHATSAVRGFLCATCNSVLGMAHDNPDILRAAACYLEHHSTNDPS